LTAPSLPDQAARAVELGLTRDEYTRLVARLGREPGDVELAMFSLMWSEHCGYKHSRKLLRTLPTEGPRLVLGPGENAGAVDVGGGMAVAFKVESHNHPSAVEPFQGAATGVGGILRDVFAVGARPIAVLDSLRFVCRQVEVEVVNPDTAFTRACARGDRLSIPVKHTTGRYYAPEPVDERQVVLRYAPGHNPNGSQDDIAGVSNAEGNVLGLMPHPEHAVDPLTGSADGLKLFESVAVERAVAA